MTRPGSTVGGRRNARGRSRGALLAAMLLAGALLMTGCVQWFLPPDTTSTSTPTDERVAPELQRFYRQTLTWRPCESTFQCATAIAPLSWSDPAGATIELALVRQPATGQRIGSLLVNPGGPGGSGYDFVAGSVDFATDETLQSRFDVVGFDPRGVGRSSAVRCYEDPAELDRQLYGIPQGEVGSDAWLQSIADESAAFGQRCLQLTGPLLGTVDTGSVARDLNMLRAALGQRTLDYLGYSYGSLLGQEYAQLFPDRVGRFVLDGAVDPAATRFESTAAQAQSFERALRSFLAECPAADGCPFTGDVDADMARIGTLFDSLTTTPLIAEDGRRLGASAMFSATILPLYTVTNWPALRELFTTVFAGDPRYAFQLADSYNGRDPGGTYRTNQAEAFLAINCLDARDTLDFAAMRDEAARLARLAPVFGPRMSWGAAGCAQWPVPAQRERVPITAPGAPDIVVIGTTNDPATAYEAAVRVADRLERGRLITFRGDGHTAYNKSNACVNDAVDAFFTDGTPPPVGLTC